jgi:3-polyprenyl-4-hydroxybenzoate decarboxylase
MLMDGVVDTKVQDATAPPSSSSLKIEWLALVEVKNVSDVKRGVCEGCLTMTSDSKGDVGRHVIIILLEVPTSANITELFHFKLSK